MASAPKEEEINMIYYLIGVALFIFMLEQLVPGWKLPKGRSEKDFPNLVKYADPASRVFP